MRVCCAADGRAHACAETRAGEPPPARPPFPSGHKSSPGEMKPTPAAVTPRVGPRGQGRYRSPALLSFGGRSLERLEVNQRTPSLPSSGHTGTSMSGPRLAEATRTQPPALRLGAGWMRTVPGEAVACLSMAACQRARPTKAAFTVGGLSFPAGEAGSRVGDWVPVASASARPRPWESRALAPRWPLVSLLPPRLRGATEGGMRAGKTRCSWLRSQLRV